MRVTTCLMLGFAMLLPAAAASPARAPAAGEDSAPAIPPPPPGMGQVVFYRSARMGMLVSCRVRENGQVVNRLPPGKYFIHQTAPGPHTYAVRSGTYDVINLEVEEGETQFVRCNVSMGLRGGPNLSPQDEADFQRRGAGLDLLPPYTGNGE